MPAEFQPPNKDIPVAPPPWTLKSKSWMYCYRDLDNKTVAAAADTDNAAYIDENPNNCEEILQGVLANGAYHPCEVVHPDALRRVDGKPQHNGIFSGLVKALVIVRYQDSDVGPYDELIVSPGFFVNPHTGKRYARITNIYVSTDASVWNGRRNWNIQKHRARFIWEPVGGKGDQLLKMYHPEDCTKPLNPKIPFFTAILKRSSLPSVPLPRISIASLVQPPLAAPRYPSGVASAVIATDDPENGRENPWLLTKPMYKGSWGLAYISHLDETDDARLEGYGDGVGFPQMKIVPIGAYFEGTIEFGLPEVRGNIFLLNEDEIF
ncbi:hypothetical protein UA08_04049 [Talaromyces atroroseus]|uniref:Acetoacetate decarboxylase n=1 Tax=Talaromyces atroroseus TaxID=1441469 RepID=A0A1Q5Q912_TALAT|nr:hypothetical protein UA08_04049 [Talaromyces atroroseus]OKL60604.1 hypothetical protein UA08_04049 [Talaromyces atroroseus]